MGKATGLLKFKDGTIKFVLFQGVFPYNSFWETKIEMLENGTTELPKCECNSEEPINLYSTYGSAFYTIGFACKNCKTVRAKLNEDEDLDDDNIFEPTEVKFDWGKHWLELKDK